MKTALKCLFVLMTLVSPSAAHSRQALTPWDGFEFLIGEWQGAEGSILLYEHFSFAFDLQKRVIVQKTHVDHPAVLGNPAYAADGLMIIYVDQVTQKVRVDYFDSSGSVLHYTAESASDGQAVTFISESDAIGLRFRTTYFKQKDGALGIRTLMAHPGSQDFNLIDEGAAYKR